MAKIKPQTLLLQSKKKKGPTRISVTTIIMCNLIVVLIVLSLVSTYRHWSQRSRSQVENGLLNHEKLVFGVLQRVDAFSKDLKKYELPGYAILNTSKGLITVELYKDAAPEIVDRFLDLCMRIVTGAQCSGYLWWHVYHFRTPYYCYQDQFGDMVRFFLDVLNLTKWFHSQKGHFKGMAFHRVIKNYVIQGGDSQTLGSAEDWTLSGKHPSELSLKHEAFMLGTSKLKHDNKGFELFITTAPIPDLNEKLIVFGRVVKGEDVIQEIEEVDTDEHYRPKSPIGIVDVTLKRDL
ncbi:hypothetical protein C5167_015067 [Papaver somniferum]|uniref:Peptidyl-prolyl cis-trans isomerase n=1 Tax=Papaver somniferum TaxID=3469 RepID=A0A4Y7J4Z8_PAPSO|nr:hypothetical protein C5167_015067 [Papaver somniferum]